MEGRHGRVEDLWELWSCGAVELWEGWLCLEPPQKNTGRDRVQLIWGMVENAAAFANESFSCAKIPTLLTPISIVRTMGADPRGAQGRKEGAWMRF